MSDSQYNNTARLCPVVLEDARPAQRATRYARTLLGLIDDLLQGRIDPGEFCEAFGDFYVEHAPDRTISLAQAELFCAVQQKIDWTDADPTPRARQNGWVDHSQLLAWLRRRVAL